MQPPLLRSTGPTIMQEGPAVQGWKNPIRDLPDPRRYEFNEISCVTTPYPKDYADRGCQFVGISALRRIRMLGSIVLQTLWVFFNGKISGWFCIFFFYVMLNFVLLSLWCHIIFQRIITKYHIGKNISVYSCLENSKFIGYLQIGQIRYLAIVRSSI